MKSPTVWHTRKLLLWHQVTIWYQAQGAWKRMRASLSVLETLTSSVSSSAKEGLAGYSTASHAGLAGKAFNHVSMSLFHTHSSTDFHRNALSSPSPILLRAFWVLIPTSHITNTEVGKKKDKVLIHAPRNSLLVDTNPVTSQLYHRPIQKTEPKNAEVWRWWKDPFLGVVMRGEMSRQSTEDVQGS